MRIRLALVGTAVAASVALSGCTYWNVNFNQWAPEARPAVIALGDAFDIKPMTYIGHDPDSFHASDFMLPGGGYSTYWINKGYALANCAVANHVKLKVHYVVYRQHIWNVERANEGWRLMEDRGSRTQNHYDHVHVTYW